MEDYYKQLKEKALMLPQGKVLPHEINLKCSQEVAMNSVY